MALREFADRGGRVWRVWDTVPVSRTLRPDFLSGWLTFEQGATRRRLVPIPEGWDSLPDSELVGLLERAAPLGRIEATTAVKTADRTIPDVSHRSLDEVPSDGGSGIQ